MALAPIATAIAIVLLGAPRAQAADGGIVVHELDGDKAPLSRAEIREAKPLDPFSRELPAGARADTGAAPSGKPGYVEGFVPPHLAVADAAGRAGAQASGFGTFSSQAVSAPTTYPNTTVGRVAGTIPGVGSYSCSAAVVHAKNQSTIFTAGHCVKEPGGAFASQLTFSPSYSNGAEPYGRWSASSVLVPRAWARQGNSNYDYAAAVLAPNPSGEAEEVVGSQGFAYNLNPKKKQFRAVGYPFNRGDTKVMWECRDKFARYDPGYRGPGPKPIGIGCDMKGGASGGPWTLPGIYLSSVTSFGYKEIPTGLFGPQLTQAANKLRKKAGKL